MTDDAPPGVARAADDRGRTAVYAADYADDPPEGLRFGVEDALGEADFDPDGMAVWVPTGEFAASALVRLPRFPSAIDGTTRRDLDLSAVRNEQQSGQLAVTTTEHVSNLSCEASDFQGESDAIPAANVTARFVGYVPVERALSEMTWSARLETIGTDAVSGTRRPDLVGDPLIDDDAVDVGPYQTQPIWFTVDVPEDVEPGEYKSTVTVTADGHGPVEFDLSVSVAEPVLPDPVAYGFHLDLWLSPDTVAREYDLEVWSEDHWDMLESYFEDLVSRGQSAVTATLVEHPWDHNWLEGTRRPTTASGYSSMVEWTYDGESWSFDFSVFDRYVETARDCGIGPRIHAFGLLGFRPPEYLDYCDGEGERVKERVEVGDERWTEAWTAFFDAFVPHLEDRGWLADTWLAVDERSEDVLEEAVGFLEAEAPELVDRLSIAGSADADPYADDLSLNTMYVPSIPFGFERSLIDESDLDGERDVETMSRDRVHARREAGETTTYYVAGTPSNPNRLTCSPAVESRLLPWIAADNDLDGLLVWSYVSWPEGVYTDPTFQYVQGDEYLAYPGPDGPASSIRWELLREGIEDFELLAAADAAVVDAEGRFAEAIETVTADLDGREVDLTAVPRARSLVVEALTGGSE